jgi:hypothetical protein
MKGTPDRPVRPGPNRKKQENTRTHAMFRKITSVALIACLTVSTLALNADPVGGAKESYTSVEANATDVYQLECYGEEATAIRIDGDNDTDLDLYVYDCNGNLIVSGESYSDYEEVVVTPFYRQTLTIKVVNRGNVYNRYAMHAW